MKKLIIKALIIGFIIGSVFFAIAPLGLGILFIENLRPVLIPGVLGVQLLGLGFGGLVSIISAIFLNGLIYSLIVLGVLSLRNSPGKSE